MGKIITITHTFIYTYIYLHALVCKISLGLILFTAKLSVRQHVVLLFTLCLHKLSYVAVPLLAHNVQHTDEECTRQGTEHPLEN